MKCPRLLKVLAILAIVYGAANALYSITCLVGLSGSQEPTLSLGNDIPPGPGAEDMKKLVETEAHVAWSRRNAIVPLACGNLIVAALVFLGASRTIGTPETRPWGRSAWQLGTLLALPCVAIEAVLFAVMPRDTLAQLPPGALADHFRQTVPVATAFAVASGTISALLLLGIALYLRSATVGRWVGATRDA